MIKIERIIAYVIIVLLSLLQFPLITGKNICLSVFFFFIIGLYIWCLIKPNDILRLILMIISVLLILSIIFLIIFIKMSNNNPGGFLQL